MKADFELRHIDRIRARGWALQILYRCEAGGSDEPVSNALAHTLKTRRVSPSRLPYLERLIAGIEVRSEEIDQRLDAALDNWSLARLATIDRAILRLGALELLFFDDVPPKVAIQEAVHLAERYGGNESPRFVNGVLDALFKSIDARP